MNDHIPGCSYIDLLVESLEDLCPHGVDMEQECDVCDVEIEGESLPNYRVRQ
jgi:hypothetical protein